jgi:hypothetical protein
MGGDLDVEQEDDEDSRLLDLTIESLSWPNSTVGEDALELSCNDLLMLFLFSRKRFDVKFVERDCLPDLAGKLV